MNLWIPLVKSTIVAGGLVSAYCAADYTYRSTKAGALAEDDFWDRCRSSASMGKLEPGRHESIVWSELNDAGLCEDVLGYCNVNKADDGTNFGTTLSEHQVNRLADDPANCTYLGWLLSEPPPFRKVN